MRSLGSLLGRRSIDAGHESTLAGRFEFAHLLEPDVEVEVAIAVSRFADDLLDDDRLPTHSGRRRHRSRRL